ncbi:MAG TPA: hypothetical protein VG122_25865 [Gemmata sp.]|nr:hypothetical protein [Gemmata sp.]
MAYPGNLATPAREGVLVFFDVKVVAVNAYGGRRYTTANRLILPRNEKTGVSSICFCSTSATEEVAVGRSSSGKGAEYVIRFLQRVRGWYERQSVWVALDQDRTHRCKCRRTRAVIRELMLHWVSLPKGSPDDNPVMTRIRRPLSNGSAAT